MRSLILGLFLIMVSSIVAMDLSSIKDNNDESEWCIIENSQSEPSFDDIIKEIEDLRMHLLKSKISFDIQYQLRNQIGTFESIVQRMKHRYYWAKQMKTKDQLVLDQHKAQMEPHVHAEWQEFKQKIESILNSN